MPDWMSDSIVKLAPALIAAHKDLGHALKNSTNPHFKSSFANLTSVIDTARPVFNDHGLTILQLPQAHDLPGAKVRTMIVHESGEWISDGAPEFPATKPDAQGNGSALSYGRRYGYATVAGVSQEDDDGNAASAPRGTAAPVSKLSAAQKAELLALWIQAGGKEIAGKARFDALPADQYEIAKQEMTAKINKQGAAA